MKKNFVLIILSFFTFISTGQVTQLTSFLADSTMAHASLSLIILDSDSNKIVAEHNPGKSLAQASILKLVTTAVALEKLGPDHKFITSVLYSGKTKNGQLDGDIIIRGGGDPALGSENFTEKYSAFVDKWIEDIKKTGIRKIKGRVITDDSYFDYEPVPSGWVWDDIGNYYGAGAYGLSIYDNTLKIHYRTGEKGSLPVVTATLPGSSGTNLKSYLTASGNSDNGYIYLAPYNTDGWISGTIPENKEDFILKGSLPDPPLFIARLLTDRLKSEHIKVKGEPATSRLLSGWAQSEPVLVSETSSPALSEIIDVLNHKSVNLYAEHLIKELGKKYKNNGSTSSGAVVIKEFLDSIGINTTGMFLEDGSGLSSLDAVNAESMARLLYFMEKNSKSFNFYFNSLPNQEMKEH
jgi:serine-type D-Ala-D-Ala carboxypeptidase/endopeptidase (penicillin-binding protein 4)